MNGNFQDIKEINPQRARKTPTSIILHTISYVPQITWKAQTIVKKKLESNISSMIFVYIAWFLTDCV